MQPSLFCTKLHKTFMVLLFAHQNSARLHYIVDEVFVGRLGMEVQITQNIETFLTNQHSLKIAYTPDSTAFSNTSECLWIHDSGLLFEDFIRPFDFVPTAKRFDVHHFGNEGNANNAFNKANLRESFIWGLFTQRPQAAISQRTNPQGDTTNETPEILDLRSAQIPFDLLSGIFWSITRYEEVQWGIAQSNESSIPPDAHGRFPAKNSLFAKLGCLETPVVDVWIHVLAGFLNITPTSTFEVIPTADIDMALRFGGRNPFTQMAAAARDLISMPSVFLDRLAVLLGKKDPYAIDAGSAQWLLTPNHSKESASTTLKSISPKLFLLASSKRDDRNKQVSEPTLIKELKRIQSKFQFNSQNIGIHPSWQEKSNALKTKTAWQEELQTLENILGETPKHSRFHFIHLHLPQSYQIIHQMGIETDWSMGYPDAAGFRAGTSVPFHWYDLTQERNTSLLVVPFCIMDVTCKNYLKLSPNQSITLGNILKQKVQSFGGLFCFVFHNESISGKTPWRGWKSVISSWFEQP
jgi:hypothetical protein